jgi:hypothetical protein
MKNEPGENHEKPVSLEDGHVAAHSHEMSSDPHGQQRET